MLFALGLCAGECIRIKIETQIKVPLVFASIGKLSSVPCSALSLSFFLYRAYPPLCSAIVRAVVGVVSCLYTLLWSHWRMCHVHALNC